MMNYDFKLKYVGQKGEIELNSYPYLLNFTNLDLFDYALDYNTSDFAFENRSKASRFSLKGRTKTLAIQICSSDKKKAIDDLDYIFNYDVEHETAGRLYVNDWYVNCYIVEAQYENFNNYNTLEVVDFTIYLETGKWINEDKHDFVGAGEEGESGVAGTFKFPFSFPFSWGAISKTVKIDNESYASTKCKIVFYGPCVNPQIVINNNVYGIVSEILENERVEVDPFSKTVVKITANGQSLNYINKRYKKNSIFEPIPVGSNQVSVSGDFKFSLIMLYERNQPQWTI